MRTVQRWEKSVYLDARKKAPKRVSNKLSDKQRQEIIEIACSSRFKDSTPYEIVAKLAEEGVYIASERTFYRILRAEGLLRHRSNRKPAGKTNAPTEYRATGPNHVWSWDITWLPLNVRGHFVYCYMIKDIWSKYIPGWEVYERESDELAAGLIKQISEKYNMNGLVLHSDNGSPMKGSSMLTMLYNLGAVASFSRPRVSNDNPFSESLFSTLKNDPGYPGSFLSIEEAREWVAQFVEWYNKKHLHSAIGYVTPEQRHYGEHEIIFNKRNSTKLRAYKKHPERWSKEPKIWHAPAVIFLNPNEQTKNELKNQKKRQLC
jgi:transposase InsO family protein